MLASSSRLLRTALPPRALTRRLLSSRPHPPPRSTLGAHSAPIVGAATALGLAVYWSRVVYQDDRVRESVLDQPSLKVPIHTSGRGLTVESCSEGGG